VRAPMRPLISPMRSELALHKPTHYIQRSSDHPPDSHTGYGIVVDTMVGWARAPERAGRPTMLPLQRQCANSTRLPPLSSTARMSSLLWTPLRMWNYYIPRTTIPVWPFGPLALSVRSVAGICRQQNTARTVGVTAILSVFGKPFGYRVLC
jgi:hypothetical protein